MCRSLILSPRQSADFDQRSTTVSTVVRYIQSPDGPRLQCILPHSIKDTPELIADSVINNITACNGSVIAFAKKKFEINRGFGSALVVIAHQKIICSSRNRIGVSLRPRFSSIPKICSQSMDPKNSADLSPQANGSAVRT